MLAVSDRRASTRLSAVGLKQGLDSILLEAVLAQIAAPLVDGETRWRHPRRRRIVEAIIALAPTDAAQAVIVAQIISRRLLTADLERREAAPDLAEDQARTLRRAREVEMRATNQAERALRRRQMADAAACNVAVAGGAR